MRLVLTGGGTGGHIYPAIEVGRLARENGADLLYFGSIRGQESAIAFQQSIPFTGFPAEPLYSLKSIRGVKALIKLQQSRISARKALKVCAPDIVFSTGGYSAGPIVAAAKDLKIPFAIHTADSVPPRSSSMFAPQAALFTCTFRSTPKFLDNIPVVRTGQPIRKQLRDASLVQRTDSEPMLLVLGGSQGSQYLNETVPHAVQASGFQGKVVHGCGVSHVESTQQLVHDLQLKNYSVVGFMNAEELVSAYRSATVAISRSGGTLAELALFGLPSILVPLPNSANDHQLHNAEEFVEMESAKLVHQSNQGTNNIAIALQEWIENDISRLKASQNLREWTVLDATDRIWNLIVKAGR